MTETDKNWSATIPVTETGWHLKWNGDTPYFRSADRSKRHANEMTALVYTLCDNRRTVAHVARELCETYPEAEQEVRRDVPAVLEQLEDYEVIRFSGRAMDDAVPAPTTPHNLPRLCIGTATYDDYDGV